MIKADRIISHAEITLKYNSERNYFLIVDSKVKKYFISDLFY